MNDTILDVAAPVTIAELTGVMEMSGRAVQYRAHHGEFGPSLVPGRHVYNLQSVPAPEREAIVARRRARNGRIAGAAAAETPILRQYPQSLELFTDEEQRLGREIRDFLIEVEMMRINKSGSTHESNIEWIARREIEHAKNHDREKYPVKYPHLLFGGKNNGCQLVAGNFYRWKARWGKWRSGVFDTSNWWCLCPRYCHAEYDRPGNGRFWAFFESLYESSVQRSRQQCYDLAIEFAARQSIADVPSFSQIHYFYRFHAAMAAVDSARQGKQHTYDKLVVTLRRNWKNVEPNLCWSGDHHMLNLFMRVPSPDVRQREAGGWIKERPWLTDWIDASSWYSVGWHISTGPSRDTIEIAYRNGILAEKGAPKYAYHDNGKDYRSFSGGGTLGFDADRVASINELLGVECIYALPHNPRAKLNERNYRVMSRFENKFYSYSGRNKKHMDALWDEKRGDGWTLRERLETWPKSHPLHGCLVRPELIPTIEDVRAGYAQWLAKERHKMVSHGRVCPGQSPEQRYRHGTGQTRLHAVSEAEVFLAFLRVHPTALKVARNGSITWTPSGGSAADALQFSDAELRSRAGDKVQVRYDLNFFPPRLFAFERVRVGNDDLPVWKQIVCGGPAGSVPGVTIAEAIAQDTDSSARLREALADSRRLSKEAKRSVDAEALREAEHEAARNIGLPDGPRQYVVRMNRGSSGAVRTAPRAAVDKIFSEITDEARRDYDFGSQTKKGGPNGDGDGDTGETVDGAGGAAADRG